MEFATKPIRHYPPLLRLVATLLWEIKNSNFWPPVNCSVPVSRNVFNSLLTPRFVQRFSGNLSINFFAVYHFKYKLLMKICLRR